MDHKKESEMFNQMADYYDKYRPDYPKKIINTIIEKVDLHSTSKLLEIGSGSGKATAQFTGFGFDIICIEPGADLIKNAKKRFQKENISFVNSRFEDYNTPHKYFDAIVSAQAFHWMPKPDAYEKCAKALRENGYLAVFWNIEIIENTDFDRELCKIMHEYNAFTSSMSHENYVKRTESISKEIAESGYFAKPQVLHAHWNKKYSFDEYFGYVSTGNVFVQNSDEMKKACYEALKQLARENNGVIARRYVCELYLAKKI